LAIRFPGLLDRDSNGPPRHDLICTHKKCGVTHEDVPQQVLIGFRRRGLGSLSMIREMPLDRAQAHHRTKLLGLKANRNPFLRLDVTFSVL
jgi:hypothetical protein